MPVVYSQRTLALFALFWAAYPHRPSNPRGPALAMFDRLLKDGEDGQALIAAASRYAEAMAAEGIKGRFLPHARRWLNQRYFDDYLPDAPAPAGASRPEPEQPSAHPMDWARSEVTAGAWTSWFSRLGVETPAEGTTDPVELIAPSAFCRDHLQREYGPLIRRQFGAVRWRIEGAER